MGNKKDLEIVNRKEIEELVTEMSFLNILLKNDLKPIRTIRVDFEKINYSFVELKKYVENFNDTLAQKVNIGPTEDILDLLNKIEEKVERLSTRLDNQHKTLITNYQDKLYSDLKHNRGLVHDFISKLSQLMIKKVEHLNLKRIEIMIDNTIKRRLENYPLENIDELIKISNLEKQLTARYECYEKHLSEMQDNSMEMFEGAKKDRNYIAKIEWIYVVAAFIIGASINDCNMLHLIFGL